MKIRVIIFFLFIYGIHSTCCQNPDWLIYNTENSSIAGNTVMSLEIDQNGVIWAGTDNGLSFFQDSAWITVDIPINKSGIEVTCLCIDKQNEKWVGTFDGGVLVYNDVSWIFYGEGNSGLPSNMIHSIAHDDQNKKWIGTTMGIGTYNGETWETYTPSNSGLPDYEVHSVCVT